VKNRGKIFLNFSAGFAFSALEKIFVYNINGCSMGKDKNLFSLTNKGERMKTALIQARLTVIFLMAGLVLFQLVSCTQQTKEVDDLFNYAQKRKNDLRFGSYITAHSVQNLLSKEAGLREALSLFRANGITKAYIEVYRGGLIVDKQVLEHARDFFLKNGIDVVGGIATVPGKDFGVRQEAQLGWFNWQNPKTPDDLKPVVAMAAGIFDEFIIDDFLCTGDTSAESKAAKGERSWSQYRRDLLSGLSSTLFIETAKKVNPDISMIIKYPQWYDRFHLFGYDVVREPALFDKVWVGTETRGQYTQRYGFVQPYEGFVNFRWLGSLSQGKISGGWFDHGDCDADDFIEQAYQTVLAGAKDIVLFHYFKLVEGHPGHHLLRMQFGQLADLAAAVAKNPVVGVAGYKPPNSDAGGDLYIMDFIGMFGVPLVPVSSYPGESKVVFLPTQAAADPEILVKVEHSLQQKATIIFTTGFLAAATDGEKLAAMAGIEWPVNISPVSAESIIREGRAEKIKYGLDLESKIKTGSAKTLLTAKAGNMVYPFLTANEYSGNMIYTLNTHTFSQADFDRVGEVLLCPKPLGMLEVPQDWANTIRQIFNNPLNIKLDAPARVALQPLAESGWVVHNYNREPVQVSLKAEGIGQGALTNGFNGEKINTEGESLNLQLGPRSRIWLKK